MRRKIIEKLRLLDIRAGRFRSGRGQIEADKTGPRRSTGGQSRTKIGSLLTKYTSKYIDNVSYFANLSLHECTCNIWSYMNTYLPLSLSLYIYMYMTMYRHRYEHIAVYGHVWPYMATWVAARHCMDTHGSSN